MFRRWESMASIPARIESISPAMDSAWDRKYLPNSVRRTPALLANERHAEIRLEPPDGPVQPLRRDSVFRYKGESDYQTSVDYYKQALVDNEGSVYFKGDTIEELAGKIGVPADTLQATVDRYNELCAKGVDEDFCKNPRFLYPIDEPPYYAAKVGAVLLEVVGGAKINTDFQCLDDQGEPIEGLYAIGNASGGGTYAVDYPINVPGNSHGKALTWGYVCGHKLAGAEPMDGKDSAR
jgi:hypothetical protein